MIGKRETTRTLWADMGSLKQIGLAAIMVAALVTPGIAQDVNWPTKPVTIVVPFNPGASNDAVARALAQQLSEDLGQAFIVENRQGAAGLVGTGHVARAEADGHTLLVTSQGLLNLGRSPASDFDPFNDLTPVAMLGRTATTMVIPSSLPANNVEEFIAWANENEGNAFFGNLGIGSIQHLHAELFNVLAGTKLTPVVYPSAAPVITDLIAGRVHMMFATISSTLPHLESGDLRLLAYSGPYVPEGSPEAPTVAEAGVTDYDSSFWWGMYAPPGLSPELQDHINAAVNTAIESPYFQQMMLNSGAIGVPMLPAEFEELMQSEYEMIDGLIESAGIVFE